MKALRATVNWNWGVGNSPSLYALVDQLPKNLRYKFKQEGGGPDHGLYFAEKEGYVSFYSYRGPDRGFGGRSFTLALENGEERTLVGPWSGSCAGMNAAGFTPSMPISLTAEPKVWRKGFTFYGCQATVEWAEKVIAEFCPCAELAAAGIRVGSGLVSDEQLLVVNFGSRAEADSTVWVVRPKSRGGKPPVPPEWDARWYDCYGKRIPMGLRGSELYAGLRRETDPALKEEKSRAWGTETGGYGQKRRDGWVYAMREGESSFKKARPWEVLYDGYVLFIEKHHRETCQEKEKSEKRVT